MPNETWTFFQAFMKSPRVVASAVPSSIFLKRRVIEAAELPDAEVVVELGAGTGGTTLSMLKALGAGGRLIAIERTADFMPALKAIDDKRFDIVHGCASSIREQLAARGYDGADAVISGIPFSTMPPELCQVIAEAIHDALRPGGRFVAYQFTDWVARYMRPVMGDPVIRHELLNVPPMRIFTWCKGELPAAALAS
jgi:phospholipid N-methyltransferase